MIRMLDKIEQERGITLPKVYKDFFSRCDSRPPDNLVGTDLVNRYSDLTQSAIELLEENNIENFLDPRDFVFMMHQGYMFWYFRADGNPDPDVYGFIETKPEPDKHAPFSEFIQEFTNR